MNRDLIVSDPGIMLGKPVVRGTRITVELILEKLGAGETIEQLLEAPPHLSPEAVLAAIAFAGRAFGGDVPLEQDPEFLRKIEAARKAIATGKGTRLEDLPE